MKAFAYRTEFVRTIAVALMIIGVISPAVVQAERVKIGEPVSNVSSLRDTLGNGRLVSDIDAKAIVLFFVGTECPLASIMMPKMLRMSDEYAQRGVKFVLVYPNEPETLVEIAAHAYERQVPFLVLKDFGAEFADMLGVTRTPTVCVLDEDKTLRYRGRVDDQYSVSSRRATARHHDLRNALDALLSGDAIAQPEVKSDGCPLNRNKPAITEGDWTYHEHIAPLIREACVDCHRPGQIGPMTLTSYDDVLDHVETIIEVIEQRRMPPWHADRRYGHFSNSRALTEKQIGIVSGWYEAGMPEGKSPSASDVSADISDTRWRIKPDAVYQMPESAQVPAEGVVPYIYYVVPTNFTEDRWVVAAEALAGNPAVVHHVIAYFIAPGRGSFYSGDGDIQILAIGGPGEGIMQVPEGTALRLPKGSELIFEMHYTPNGIATKDLSKVGVVFADKPPERELRIHMFGNEDLSIPPHATHHAHQAEFTFAKDGEIFAILPHMHWRGKSYQAWIDRADGEKNILLSVPRYDFNWQTYYRFADPVKVGAGTTIKSVAHWDNSADNLSNPDPTIEVEYGLQSSEEMMYGFLTYVYDEPVQEPKLAKPNAMAAVMFKRMDKDKDGLVDSNEMPASIQKQLDEAGMEIRGGLTPLMLEALMSM